MSTRIGTADAVAARFASALDLDEPWPAQETHGLVCLDVPVQRWHDALAMARDDLRLDFFDWLSAVDEPTAEPPAVDVLVHLVCSTSGGALAVGLTRMLLRTRVSGSVLAVASVTDLYAGAAWHERETHEMFGVDFPGFDDGSRTADGDPLGLRPLLLPDGFEGTPLRKSFVLAARASKPWPGAKEPGDSDAGTSPSRRKMLPPGVPDPSWGPRDA